MNAMRVDKVAWIPNERFIHPTDEDRNRFIELSGARKIEYELSAEIEALKTELAAARADRNDYESRIEEAMQPFLKRADGDGGSYWEIGGVATDNFDEAFMLYGKELAKLRALCAEAATVCDQAENVALCNNSSAYKSFKKIAQTIAAAGRGEGGDTAQNCPRCGAKSMCSYEGHTDTRRCSDDGCGLSDVCIPVGVWNRLRYEPILEAKAEAAKEGDK